MLRHLTRIIGLIALAVLLTACLGGTKSQTPGSSQVGSIQLQVDVSAAYDEGFSVQRVQATLRRGTVLQTLDLEVDATNRRAVGTFGKVDAGQWNVDVIVLDDQQQTIGTGTATVSVAGGRTTPLNISITLDHLLVLEKFLGDGWKVAMSLALTSGPTLTPAGLENYWPLIPGNTWTYQMKYRPDSNTPPEEGRVTPSVIGTETVNGVSTVILETTNEFAETSITSQELFAFENSAYYVHGWRTFFDEDFGLDEEWTYFDEPIRILPVPLEIGEYVIGDSFCDHVPSSGVNRVPASSCPSQQSVPGSPYR